MGHVYRATQSPLAREVAIKVLRVDLAHQEGVAERFEREALAASRIQHPNAITIFEFGKDGEILFLAMEFLAGETLRQRLRREPPLEVNEALDMFEAMAGALGAAHKVGVVHRDLKPDNIFLAKFDTVGQVVKVLDFGLAKLLDTTAMQNDQLTAPNLRLGTPRYMAPEQALGIQPIDSRCDVYALGLLLFEMLAQRAPFVGEDGMEVLAQRLRREAPRLSQVAPQKNFSEQMDELLANCLKRDREHRPLDANVVLGRIREIRKNNQVTAAVADAALTMVNPPDQGRSGAYAPVAGGRPAQGQPGWNRAGSDPGAGRTPPRQEAMVRLDQDDFPEKPTVVVDPGMMDGPPGMRPMTGMQPALSGMQAPIQLRQSNPGPLSGGDPNQPMQMYPASQPMMAGGAPGVATSTSIPPVGQKRTRTMVMVGVVILLAVLAPLIALLVRFAKGNGDEHSDPGTGSEVIRPSSPPKSPPPPVTDSDKPTSEPTTDPPVDKGPKKPIKKKPVSKPKVEAKPKPEPRKPVF